MADVKALKLLFVVSGSFICAALLGELISLVIGLIIPASLIYIAWVFDGLVAGYIFLLLQSIGIVFVYPPEKDSDAEDFIKSQENIQSIAAVFVLIVASAILANALLVENEKRLIIALSMIIIVIILFAFGRMRLVRNRKLEKRKDELKERIANSLLVQTLAGIQIELESDLYWKDRQRLKLDLVWLETLLFVGKSVDKPLEEKVLYFESVDEVDMCMPDILDIKSFSDFKFSQDVAFEYAEFLHDSGQDDKAESSLPFPKTDIVRICKHYGRCLSKDLFVSRALLMADKERAKKVSFAVLEAEVLLKNKLDSAD